MIKYALLHVERAAFETGIVKPVGTQLRGKNLCMAHVKYLLTRDWKYAYRTASREKLQVMGLSYDEAILFEDKFDRQKVDLILMTRALYEALYGNP